VAHPSRLAVKNGEHLRMTKWTIPQITKLGILNIENFACAALRHSEFAVMSRNPFKEK
jgi:hypothetical protein